MLVCNSEWSRDSFAEIVALVLEIRKQPRI
jgi:hypothetical protein